VFATVGDMHLQIDTRGQAGYDATGLGRLHRRGVPIETALNMSIVQAPGYHMPLAAAPRSVALGAGWPCGEGWRYLSEADRETHEVEVTRHGGEGEVDFTVTYRFHDPAAWGAGEVRERYWLTGEGLRGTITVPGVERLRLQVPLIETDGAECSVMTAAAGVAEVRYRGHRFFLQVEPPGATSFLEPWAAPNRNGVYRVALFEVAGEAISYAAAVE
ncbi:MAG: hypothetical protein KKI08_06560, partial [Armatimonadetes bacterium]|nr:hypothetical protein [Armatimonadota bacterium]